MQSFIDLKSLFHYWAEEARLIVPDLNSMPLATKLAKFCGQCSQVPQQEEEHHLYNTVLRKVLLMFLEEATTSWSHSSWVISTYSISASENSSFVNFLVGLKEQIFFVSWCFVLLVHSSNRAIVWCFCKQDKKNDPCVQLLVFSSWSNFSGHPYQECLQYHLDKVPFLMPDTLGTLHHMRLRLCM